MGTKTKTAYLAGPMSGYENNNFAAFDAFTTALEEQTEYSIISPANLDRQLGFDGTEVVTGGDLRKVLTEDIEQLMQCDAIMLMPGWQKSSGARLESHIAKTLGLELVEINWHRTRDNILQMTYVEASEIPDGIPQVV